MNAASVFPSVFIAMFVGHHVGDYLVQTRWQVEHKGDRGWRGWRAATTHAGTYTIATTWAVLATAVVLGLPLTLLGVVACQLVSAVSHLVIDRRFTLRWLIAQVDRLIPGKLAYYDAGGSAFLDQMAHMFFLCLSALVAAAVTI